MALCSNFWSLSLHACILSWHLPSITHPEGQPPPLDGLTSGLAQTIPLLPGPHFGPLVNFVPEKHMFAPILHLYSSPLMQHAIVQQFGSCCPNTWVNPTAITAMHKNTFIAVLIYFGVAIGAFFLRGKLVHACELPRRIRSMKFK